MANKLEVKIDMPTDAELERMFDAQPKLRHHEVQKKAIAEGVKPIVRKAKQLAPRSKPEDRAKRSKKQRGQADWDYPLWKTIKHVIRVYTKTAFGVVGPEWPKGNKAYFDTTEGGRQVFYWGRDAGKTKAQIRNWIVMAFDSTKPQQLAAMKAKLKSLMNDLWLDK